MTELPEEAVEAAAKAFTDELNPHLGGEAWADEVSALVECGMPEALKAAAPAIRKQERERLRADPEIKQAAIRAFIASKRERDCPADCTDHVRPILEAAAAALEDSDER